MKNRESLVGVHTRTHGYFTKQLAIMGKFIFVPRRTWSAAKYCCALGSFLLL